VGYVVINRPGSLNAFNLDLAEQFIDTVEAHSRDETVRAVVIRGEGKIFSAGGDVKEMLNDVRSGTDRAAYFRAPLAAFNRMNLCLRETPKPVLAAVHGAVAGVAFNLMLACDLSIAAEGTRFTQAFIRLGVSPDGGGTHFLPRLVGYARACELTMLPTELDAETALRWGLINWVVPADRFEAEAKIVAERLAAGPAAALRRTKQLLNQTHDRSLAEQMEAERLAQVENAADENFGEGLAAFVEKRAPQFNRP
jgi:2-(1,2-epoxy-1,2-dihydrophenyl)acetyl-CoA isomerase